MLHFVLQVECGDSYGIQAGVEEDIMKRGLQSYSSIELLLQKYRIMFRTPENLNHYSDCDLEIAERKFLKYALAHRIVALREELPNNLYR